MHYTKWLAAGIALAGSTVATAAFAENTTPESYFYIGGHLSENLKNINDRTNTQYGLGGASSGSTITLPGLQLGYRFSENWSVQAWWERRTNRSLSDAAYQDINVALAFASVKRHFGDNPRMEPYLGIGAGEYRTRFNATRETLTETVAGFEMGIHSLLNPLFQVDLGVRPYHSFRTERWDLEVYAGINLLIGTTFSGEAEPVIDPMTIDSDGDGVPDYRDACPDTPQGVSVDDRGCPLDSDGDGVPDYRDDCPNTPAGALVDARGCQIYLTEDISQTLYIEFGLDQSEVRQTAYPELEALAESARQYPSAELRLEGHTDSTGPAAYNMRLGQQRADAVKAVLVNDFNIDAERVKTVSFGEGQPIADNDTDEGRAQNRRVEAVLEARAEKPQFE